MYQMDDAKSYIFIQLHILVTRGFVQQTEPHDVHDVPAARAGAGLREVALPGRVQQVTQSSSNFDSYGTKYG